MHYTTNKFFTLLIATMILCISHVAQAVPVQRVGGLDVRGNERIEAETIRSLLVQEPGGGFSEDSLNKSLKRLYDSGYFRDVKLKIVNQVLVVQVEENPSINRIGFDGNDDISDDILKSEIGMAARQPLTRSKIKKAVNAIKRIYRYKGFFVADVTPKVVKLPQNRVDVVFEIEEGNKTKVGRIFFIGNSQFSEGKLETTIQTKESRWYRSFSTDDNYDPDRLAYDRELLLLFYLEHGYADFRVKSAVAELTPDKKEFFITFTLDEGARYKISTVSVTSKLPNVDPVALEKLATFGHDDVYNNKEVEKTFDKITDEVGRLGYAFVDVFPNIEKDQATNTIAINFVLSEGPRVYVEKISINGNDRTDDDVIRRELLLYEGDAFNADKMKKSERRIRNLGYFKNVKIIKEPGSYPDRINIAIEVEEDRSGELSIAGGFSTSDGPIAEFKFAEHNFRGRGQDLSFGVTWAKRRQEFDISFTEPYFLGRDLAAGIDLYRITQNKYFNQTFDQKIHGMTLRMGYHLAEDLGQQVSYTLRRDEISGVKGDSSRFIKEQRGQSILSELGHTVSYDKRDSRINTTQGYVLGFGNNLAGLGGNIRYLKNSVFGAYYYSLMDDWIVEFSGRYSFMTGLGKDVRVVDRYTLGADTLRGFETSGVGPRDRTTNDPLGGLQSYVGTVELTFPIGLPNEFGVKGATFIEGGSVWKSGDPSAEVKDQNKFRSSIGVGLRWRSPLGPLKIDLAYAMTKAKFDKTQPFLFGMSTRF